MRQRRKNSTRITQDFFLDDMCILGKWGFGMNLIVGNLLFLWHVSGVFGYRLCCSGVLGACVRACVRASEREREKERVCLV